MKNTKTLSEIVELLKEDLNNLNSQYNKKDMYALYFAKTLEDLARFEENTLSVDSFYKNFRKYLQKAVQDEINKDEPDYSVEAGLESALDLLEWYYLKCQSSKEIPECNTLIRTTKELENCLTDFIDASKDLKISSSVKARMEIVILLLNKLLDETLNPEDPDDTDDSDGSDGSETDETDNPETGDKDNTGDTGDQETPENPDENKDTDDKGSEDKEPEDNKDLDGE